MVVSRLGGPAGKAPELRLDCANVDAYGGNESITNRSGRTWERRLHAYQAVVEATQQYQRPPSLFHWPRGCLTGLVARFQGKKAVFHESFAGARIG